MRSAPVYFKNIKMKIINKTVISNIEVISDFLKTQDNTDQIKRVGEALINIEETIDDIQRQSDIFENQNYSDEETIDRLQSENQSLTEDLAEMTNINRDVFTIVSLIDQMKLKVCENLHRNITLTQLEAIQEQVIKQHKQENKLYLTF